MAKREVLDRIVQGILHALEQERIPWEKPWTVSPNRNLVTGHVYTGINRLLTATEAMRKGYSSPYWLTYKQAKAKGGHVKRGEHGLPIIYWAIKERKVNVDGEERVETYPIMRVYTVFNSEQCEGIETPTADRIEPVEPHSIANAYLATSGVVLQHAGDRAYYRPDTDTINMPHSTTFASPEHYHATLFHEMVHSTGHESRLNRDVRNVFGDHKYSVEELIAEIGSAYLCALTGISTTDTERNTTAYCQHWARAIKADPNIILQAAQKAEKAIKYITDTQPSTGPTERKESTTKGAIEHPTPAPAHRPIMADRPKGLRTNRRWVNQSEWQTIIWQGQEYICNGIVLMPKHKAPPTLKTEKILEPGHGPTMVHEILDSLNTANLHPATLAGVEKADQYLVARLQNGQAKMAVQWQYLSIASKATYAYIWDHTQLPMAVLYDGAPTMDNFRALIAGFNTGEA